MPTNGPLAIAVVAACPFPWPRGTPIRVLRTAEALAELGHRVEIFTYPLGEGPVDPRLAIARVRHALGYHRTAPGPSPAKLLLLDPQLCLSLRRRLRRAPPIDVIYAHHVEGLLVALAARRDGRPPVVFDAHTLLGSELPTYGGRLLRPVLRRLAARLDRSLPVRADHVTAVTDRIRAKLVDELGLPADRVTTVPNGVEVDHFAAVPPAGPLPADRPPRILFTGNTAPYQRLDLLLDAFARLARRHAAVELLLAVDGDTADLHRRIAAAGLGERVRVVPAVPFDRLPALLAEADVAANPRIDADGAPVKLLNYMAAGRPVVSFRGAAPGVEHERTGLLCDDGDVEAFARALSRLLEDRALAARLGAAARARVAAHARWSHAGRRLELVMRTLVARGAEPSPALRPADEPIAGAGSPGR